MNDTHKSDWLPANPAPLVGVALIMIVLLLLGIRAGWSLLSAAYAVGYAASVAPVALFVALVVGFPFGLVYWGNNKED